MYIKQDLFFADAFIQDQCLYFTSRFHTDGRANIELEEVDFYFRDISSDEYTLLEDIVFWKSTSRSLDAAILQIRACHFDLQNIPSIKLKVTHKEDKPRYSIIDRLSLQKVNSAACTTTSLEDLWSARTWIEHHRALGVGRFNIYLNFAVPPNEILYPLMQAYSDFIDSNSNNNNNNQNYNNNQNNNSNNNVRNSSLDLWISQFKSTLPHLSPLALILSTSNSSSSSSSFITMALSSPILKNLTLLNLAQFYYLSLQSDVVLIQWAYPFKDPDTLRPKHSPMHYSRPLEWNSCNERESYGALVTLFNDMDEFLISKRPIHLLFQPKISSHHQNNSPSTTKTTTNSSSSSSSSPSIPSSVTSIRSAYPASCRGLVIGHYWTRADCPTLDPAPQSHPSPYPPTSLSELFNLSGVHPPPFSSLEELKACTLYVDKSKLIMDHIRRTKLILQTARWPDPSVDNSTSSSSTIYRREIHNVLNHNLAMPLEPECWTMGRYPYPSPSPSPFPSPHYQQTEDTQLQEEEEEEGEEGQGDDKESDETEKEQDQTVEVEVGTEDFIFQLHMLNMRPGSERVETLNNRHVSADRLTKGLDRLLEEAIDPLNSFYLFPNSHLPSPQLENQMKRIKKNKSNQPSLLTKLLQPKQQQQHQELQIQQELQGSQEFDLIYFQERNSYFQRLVSQSTSIYDHLSSKSKSNKSSSKSPPQQHNKFKRKRIKIYKSRSSNHLHPIPYSKPIHKVGYKSIPLFDKFQSTPSRLQVFLSLSTSPSRLPYLHHVINTIDLETYNVHVILNLPVRLFRSLHWDSFLDASHNNHQNNNEFEKEKSSNNNEQKQQQHPREVGEDQFSSPRLVTLSKHTFLHSLYPVFSNPRVWVQWLERDLGPLSKILPSLALFLGEKFDADVEGEGRGEVGYWTSANATEDTQAIHKFAGRGATGIRDDDFDNDDEIFSFLKPKRDQGNTNKNFPPHPLPPPFILLPSSRPMIISIDDDTQYPSFLIHLLLSASRNLQYRAVVSLCGVNLTEWGLDLACGRKDIGDNQRVVPSPCHPFTLPFPSFKVDSHSQRASNIYRRASMTTADLKYFVEIPNVLTPHPLTPVDMLKGFTGVAYPLTSFSPSLIRTILSMSGLHPLSIDIPKDPSSSSPTPTATPIHSIQAKRSPCLQSDDLIISSALRIHQVPLFRISIGNDCREGLSQFELGYRSDALQYSDGGHHVKYYQCMRAIGMYLLNTSITHARSGAGVIDPTFSSQSLFEDPSKWPTLDYSECKIPHHSNQQKGSQQQPQHQKQQQHQALTKNAVSSQRYLQAKSREVSRDSSEPLKLRWSRPFYDLSSTSNSTASLFHKRCWKLRLKYRKT